MEANLKYVGMAGTSFDPKVKFDIPDGPSSPVGGGPSDSLHWSTVIGNLIPGVANLGMTAAQIIAAIKGNQPIVIANPTTGQQTNVTPMLKKEIEEKGEDKFFQMMALMIANQNKPQPQPEPKDNTMLYVGVGFGALVLVGLMVFALKK